MGARLKLTDLNPGWIGHGGEDVSGPDGKEIPRREGVGVIFDCPCGCDSRCYVPFSNPLDGGGVWSGSDKGWMRSGSTFADLTTTPSIHRIIPCGWHGYITNGEIITA
jgi:hypothetical protein